MDYSAIRRELRGPAVLSMTPFTEDFQVNPAVVKQNVRHVVDGGISTGKGFIICPSGTGEYDTLTRDEHRQVVQAALQAAGGDIPIVVGICSNSHFEVIERCNIASELGAKCAMIPPPYYYHGLDQDAVVRWYATIAEQTDIGLMVYDQSWRKLGGSVDGQAIGEMIKIPSVVSIKRGAMPSLTDYTETLDMFSDKVSVVDNSYGYTAGLAHMHGASSYITGIGAFWPEGEAEFWSLLESGKYAEADKLHSRQAKFWHFVDGPKGGFATGVLKAAAEYVGIEAGPPRPPFARLNDEERKFVHQTLVELGVKSRLTK